MFHSESPDWIALIDEAKSSDVVDAYLQKLSKLSNASQTSSSKTDPSPAHSYTPSQSLLQYCRIPQSEVLEDSPDLFGSGEQRKETEPQPAHSEHGRTSHHLSEECFEPAGHGQSDSLLDQEGRFAQSNFEQFKPVASRRDLKPFVKFSFSLVRDCKPVRNYRKPGRNEVKPTLGFDRSDDSLDNEDLDVSSCDINSNLSFQEEDCRKESGESNGRSGEVVRSPRNQQMLSATTSNIVLDQSQDAQNDPEFASSPDLPDYVDEHPNLHQSPAQDQDQYNLESQNTPTAPCTPESSDDWLGVESSQDLFADGSASPALPSREFYLNEEEKIQDISEKIEQERKDHILALRISKGMDPFSGRSLRSRGKIPD